MANANPVLLMYENHALVVNGATVFTTPQQHGDEPAVNALFPDRYTRWRSNAPVNPMNFEIDVPDGVFGVQAWGLVGFLAETSGALGTVTFSGWDGSAWLLLDSFNTIPLNKVTGDFMRMFAAGTSYTYSRYRFGFATNTPFYVSGLMVGRAVDCSLIGQPVMGSSVIDRQLKTVIRTMGGNPIVTNIGKPRRVWRLRFENMDDSQINQLRLIAQNGMPMMLRDMHVISYHVYPSQQDVEIVYNFGSPFNFAFELELEQLPP